MKLKLTSDGTVLGTKIINAETGEELKGVRGLSWHSPWDDRGNFKAPTLVVEVLDLQVEALHNGVIESKPIKPEPLQPQFIFEGETNPRKIKSEPEQYVYSELIGMGFWAIAVILGRSCTFVVKSACAIIFSPLYLIGLVATYSGLKPPSPDFFELVGSRSHLPLNYRGRIPPPPPPPKCS